MLVGDWLSDMHKTTPKKAWLSPLVDGKPRDKNQMLRNPSQTHYSPHLGCRSESLDHQDHQEWIPANGDFLLFFQNGEATPSVQEAHRLTVNLHCC